MTKKTLLTGCIFSVISSVMSFSVLAQMGKIEEEVYVSTPSRAHLNLIEGHPELIIDHLTREGMELFGPRGMKKWLKEAGIAFKAFESSSNHSHDSTKINATAGYPTYEQMTRNLKSLAKKYPSIMQLSSIGKSVKGRELWVVKVSDNVNMDEAEPEFKYISSMHGDEITGRELTQFFLKDLLEGYGKNLEITKLINNTEIYIMPSMNPDGSKRRQRANANGYDLNRNFPMWNASRSEIRGRQPETIAVMNFQKTRQFSLSANFHGGAVVVNYPWDSTKTRHPLDSLLQELSVRYAILNRPMYNSSEFEQGITNGADWYVVRGGMQDWSYVFYNDLQITVELSEQKWPRYSEIPSFYQDNKDSMMAYLASIHQGAGFKLASSKDGSVVIKRKSYDGTTMNMGQFGFRSGEFYKVLPEGEYIFSISLSDGQKTQVEMRVEKDMIKKNGNYTYVDLSVVTR